MSHEIFDSHFLNYGAGGPFFYLIRIKRGEGHLEKVVTMSTFTEQDRSFCVEEFFRNGNSAVLARAAFRKKHGFHNNRNCPSKQLIISWTRKFRSTENTARKQYSPRQKPARTPEKIRAVSSSITENPRSDDFQVHSRLPGPPFIESSRWI